MCMALGGSFAQRFSLSGSYTKCLFLLSPLILSNYDVLKLCHPPLGCYQDVVPVIASLCFAAHVPHVDAQY